jgi:hypothetical protein
MFYLDASIPVPVAKALSLVRPDIAYPGSIGCPVTGASMKDPIWLPLIGERGWPVIMRDKRIRDRPLERESFKAHRMKGFVLTGAGSYSRWQTLELLVRRWEDMTARVDLPGPWMFALTQGPTRELPLH